ncbi:MAG: hypothetical protein ACI909_002432 [Planctomycetota bacterium]|jgi:uncharacterized protein YyaL (SSP411 family)
MKKFILILLALGGLSISAVMADKIQWQQWGKAPFEKAKSEDKMILLDVGMEGCTACRWMDELTYTNDDVIKLINTHFVAIVADAEGQPDVGERYSDWAWPATIFMAPDSTQVLALSGNRQPANFIPILEELIKKKASNQLEADQLAPYSAPPEPEKTELTAIRDNVRAQLDAQINDEFGGWSRSGISTAGGARLEHLYLRAHMFNNKELEALALLTTEGYIKAIDPVWGGVFVQRFHDNANLPKRFQRLGAVPEKRLSNQANALIAFSNAYKISGDLKYLQAIKDVDRFVSDWMMDVDGTFYTSQEDDAPGLTNEVDTFDYWLLDSSEKREKYGIPPIDHAIYTDKNSQAIMAYAAAYEATTEQAYLETAKRAANSLIKSRMQDDDWILQSLPSASMTSDKRMRKLIVDKKPVLAAQAWFGSALLSLYQVTGEDEWLERASSLGNAMLIHLYDEKIGGFYTTAIDETASIIPPRKPLELNARAAHFFYDLWILTKNDRYAKIPELTLRSVAIKDIISREGKITGQTAMALEKLTAAYVEFSVVGDDEDPATLALFEAGKQAYHPRKLLHYEKTGRYPRREKPAMYICNPDRCSIPIEDPALVATQSDSFRLPASFSP